MDRQFEMFDSDGPTVVEMVRACKSLNALPRPGGLFEQDSFFVHMVSVYDAAMAEREALDARKAQNQAKARTGH